MKTIGLIGGMSWESTVVYYQMLNRMARERLGGLHSAELIMWSFDFAEIEALQAAGDWAAATARMVEAARNVENGGAACIVICTNTMHKMAGDVQEAVEHPADPHRRHDRRRDQGHRGRRASAARHPLHHGAGLL